MRNPAVVIAAVDAVLITAIAVRGVMVRRVGRVLRGKVKAARGHKARVVHDPVDLAVGKAAVIGAVVVEEVFAGAMIVEAVSVADVLMNGANCRRFRRSK